MRTRHEVAQPHRCILFHLLSRLIRSLGCPKECGYVWIKSDKNDESFEA